MAKIERNEIVSRLRNLINASRAIIGTSAGIGIAAKCQAYAGADLIVVDNSARFRMAGYGSYGGNFAYKNSTDMLYRQACDILPLVTDVPVIAGVTAAEPLRDIHTVINDMSEMGFSGICNSPSVGWYDPKNAKNLKKLGLGYDQEVRMIAYAHQRDLLTVAVCYDAGQAREMASAGADIIVAEIGLTEGGMIGAKALMPFEEARSLIQIICDAARGVRQDVIVLCHGGLLSTPAAVSKMLNALNGVNGFLGGSATDRLPMEQGIVRTAEGFKATRLYGFGENGCIS